MVLVVQCIGFYLQQVRKLRQEDHYESKIILGYIRPMSHKEAFMDVAPGSAVRVHKTLGSIQTVALLHYHWLKTPDVAAIATNTYITLTVGKVRSFSGCSRQS